MYFLDIGILALSLSKCQQGIASTAELSFKNKVKRCREYIVNGGGRQPELDINVRGIVFNDF